LNPKHWGPNLKYHQTLNWKVILKRKIELTKESKTKNKIQENEDQTLKNKIKIIDLKMKLKTNKNLIKELKIKIWNQNIEILTLNIIKLWIKG